MSHRSARHHVPNHPECGTELRYHDLLPGMLVAAYADSEPDLILKLWVAEDWKPGLFRRFRTVMLHSHAPDVDVRLYVQPDGSFRDSKGIVIRLHEHRGPVDNL